MHTYAGLQRRRFGGHSCRMIWLPLLVLMLCGCAVKRPPSTQQLVKDVMPSTTTIPGTWTEKDAVPGPVEDGWVKKFADPQLEAIVSEAIKNNLDLKAAATRIAVADNMITEAHSQMMPIVGASGAASVLGRYNQKNLVGKNKGRYNASSVLAGISWELDVWGRIRSQTAAAKQQLAATRADFLYAQESLAGVVAKVWFLTAYTKMLQQYAEQNVDLKRQALELAEAKRDVGGAQDQQVAIALANLATARSQLADLRSYLQQIVRGLEVLLGRYPAAELNVSAAVATLPPPVPAGLPLQLLERRPDILAAQHNVNAAFHLIQSVQAARLPSVSLTAGAGYLTNEIYQKLNFRPWIWTASGNLAAPLYTGGFLGAQVNVAREDQRAALYVYGETILEAFAEVETVLANERYLREQQQELSSALDNVSRALALERTKFEIGQVDLDPVIQLQEAELGGKVATTQIEYQLLANRVSLHLALGGNC